MTTLRDLQKFSEGLAAHEQKMPLLFVGHGNPMNAIEDNEFSEVKFFNDKTVLGSISMTSFKMT